MNETIRTIHCLRTIHGNFSDKEIQESDLQTILKACVRAANASARQSYSIIVVEEEITKELKWPGARTLLFCVDFMRLIDSATHIGERFDVKSFLAFLTGVVDTTLAAQTAVIAAKSLGIDSLMTNRIYRTGQIKEMQNRLGLPMQHCFPLLLVCLGYASTEPPHRQGRLTDLGIVHHGKYHRLTPSELDQIVQEYDDPDKHLGWNEYWKANWKANGFAHYLSWFFSNWSQTVETWEQAETLIGAIRTCGFFHH